MTDRIALVLGLAVLAFLLADRFFLSGEASYFLARKFVILIDWVAFWR